MDKFIKECFGVLVGTLCLSTTGCVDDAFLAYEGALTPREQSMLDIYQESVGCTKLNYRPLLKLIYEGRSGSMPSVRDSRPFEGDYTDIENLEKVIETKVQNSCLSADAHLSDQLVRYYNKQTQSNLSGPVVGADNQLNVINNNINITVP